MRAPNEILATLLARATSEDYVPLNCDKSTREKISFVVRECTSNRAGVRLLMACLLAKIHMPEKDPTKPYTEIGSDDCFSGRTYDEKYLSRFIADNDLPCNPTTAFLTPALRNIDTELSEDLDIVGRPRRVYTDTIALLHMVKSGRIDAEALFCEVIHGLLWVRDQKKQSLEEKLRSLRCNDEEIVLSSEETVTLIQQHLACKHASRLPVLIVAAAYEAAKNKIGERILPLLAHNAADEQTGSMGDVEVCLINDDDIRTVYEMKMKKVLRGDIDRAIQKIVKGGKTIDNYIFITTDEIDPNVLDYAKGMYESLGQREIAILDCIGFLRHFLHLFHRLRRDFLDEYQNLLLNESESAVRHELKEVFLHLRQVAESRD